MEIAVNIKMAITSNAAKAIETATKRTKIAYDFQSDFNPKS